MFRLSLRSLFVQVALVGIASSTLIQPGMATTIVVMLATVICLLMVFTLGAWRLNYFAISMVCLGCCYLIVADGGVFPKMEKNLPTEWLLERGPGLDTTIHSGVKSFGSMSLTLWMVCEKHDHYDRKSFSAFDKVPREETNDTSVKKDTGPTGISVKIPEYAITSKQTFVTISKRDHPQNRTYFILGHCWFVILISMFVLTTLFQGKRKTRISVKINGGQSQSLGITPCGSGKRRLHQPKFILSPMVDESGTLTEPQFA